MPYHWAIPPTLIGYLSIKTYNIQNEAKMHFDAVGAVVVVVDGDAKRGKYSLKSEKNNFLIKISPSSVHIFINKLYAYCFKY